MVADVVLPETAAPTALEDGDGNENDNKNGESP